MDINPTDMGLVTTLALTKAVKIVGVTVGAVNELFRFLSVIYFHWLFLMRVGLAQMFVSFPIIIFLQIFDHVQRRQPKSCVEHSHVSVSKRLIPPHVLTRF